MRVLGPGFWDTRRLARLAGGYSKPPVAERLIVYVCKITRLVLELFFILKKCGAILLWEEEEKD